jgi:hypothetical protein
MRLLSIASILIAAGCATSQHATPNTQQPNAGISTLADAVALASTSPNGKPSVEPNDQERSVARDPNAKPKNLLVEIVGAPASAQPKGTP